MAIIIENKLSENVVDSGTSTIAGLTTVIVTTKIRAAGESFFPSGFITNNIAGASWAESAVAVGISDSVGAFLDRTANANEFNMRLRNMNAVSTRTIDWKLNKTM